MFDWKVIEPDEELTIGDLACRFSATDHGPTTLATRLDTLERTAGLVYTADTGAEWSAEELGTGIGTLLCDATYTQADEGKLRHLSGRQAGAYRVGAGAGRRGRDRVRCRGGPGGPGPDLRMVRSTTVERTRR